MLVFLPDILSLNIPICRATAAVASWSEPCRLTTSTWVVSGDYGMWNMNISQCLQKMSDSIVEATSPYITPNQTIPGWVMNLPEPIRSEKIGMHYVASVLLGPLIRRSLQRLFKSMDPRMFSNNFSHSMFLFFVQCEKY